MTTIIGIEYKNHSLIIADSRVIDDSGRIYAHQAMKKIAKRGSLLVAGAGEVTPCDIAQNIWIPPNVTANARKDPYTFMITKIMPSLRKCLTDNGYNFDEDKKDGMRFQFLISCAGELFDIDEDLSVMKNEDNFYAIGSGGSFALGALYAGAEPIKAMEIASKVSAYSAPPYYKEVQSK